MYTIIAQLTDYQLDRIVDVVELVIFAVIVMYFLKRRNFV